MYYLNKDSKSRWIQEYQINLSIRHIQTYVVMVPQGVSNTITLSTWELLHQRNNIIAANRQKLHQSTVKPRYYESLIQQPMLFASFIAKYMEKKLDIPGETSFCEHIFANPLALRYIEVFTYVQIPRQKCKLFF